MTQGRRKWANEALVVFVEGYSDLTFYAELLERLDLTDNFIQDIGGKSKLANEALLLLKPDNLARMKAVAVVLDADQDPDASFELARRAILKAADLDVAQRSTWFVQPRSKVRFGIFVVGGANGTGEVESLAWEAWKSDVRNTKLTNCIEDFIVCSAKAGLELHSVDKVRIGAAFSVLNEDDPRLGSGARANLIDFDADQFTTVRNFFLELKPFL